MGDTPTKHSQHKVQSVDTPFAIECNYKKGGRAPQQIEFVDLRIWRICFSPGDGLDV
jgi:hypothetical protein